MIDHSIPSYHFLLVRRSSEFYLEGFWRVPHFRFGILLTTLVRHLPFFVDIIATLADLFLIDIS